MNALGKTLTVFVFLGSLVWLGFTVALFSTRADWKKAALDSEKAAQDAFKQNEANVQRVLERERLADARLSAAEQTLQAITAERNTYRKDYDDLKQTTKEVALKTAELMPTLNEYQQANTSNQLTIDALTKESRTIAAEREAAVLAAQKAENTANDTRLKLNVTEKALNDQIERTRALAEASRSGAAAADADFRGDVLQVDKTQKDVILFSGGLNSGVKVGRRYVVKRAVAPFYVGTVTVLEADVKTSSGVFTPSAGQKLAGDYIPKVGDSVSSQ